MSDHPSTADITTALDSIAALTVEDCPLTASMSYEEAMSTIQAGMAARGCITVDELADHVLTELEEDNADGDAEVGES